jgi:hypothetical protein
VNIKGTEYDLDFRLEHRGDVVVVIVVVGRGEAMMAFASYGT